MSEEKILGWHLETLHYDMLWYVEIGWDTLGYDRGICWDMLGYVGIRCDTLVDVGIRWYTLGYVDIHLYNFKGHLRLYLDTLGYI